MTSPCNCGHEYDDHRWNYSRTRQTCRRDCTCRKYKPRATTHHAPGTPVVPARRLLEIEHVVGPDQATTVCGIDLTDLEELWIEWGKGGVTTCATCAGHAAAPALDLFLDGGA